MNSYDCIEHLAAVPRVTSFPEHINSFPEHINQIFHDVFPEMDSLEQSLLAPMSLAPKTDVYEEADRIVLEMEAPGLKQEDLNLTLKGNTLTIGGERKRSDKRKEGRFQRMERYDGSFSRSFTLPSTVDPNSIEGQGTSMGSFTS